ADGAKSVFAIDIDDDGDTDILSASAVDDKIAWYENNGSESFTEHTISTNADGAKSVFAIDIDDDGDTDVLSASVWDDKIAWYENNGSQSFTEYTISTNADGAKSVFAIDIDDDGDTDVLSASLFDDKIAWYDNNGSESFTEDTISINADDAGSVFAIDIDGDGDTDVLSASHDDDKIAWYENNGSQSFTEHIVSMNADYPKSVFAIDMDVDGDIDILSASGIDDKIAWYENNGSESFTEHTISTNADGAQSVFAIDMEGDSDIDILSASSVDDKIVWYENNGSESFTEHIISTNADGANSVFAIDIDGDGDTDVLSSSAVDGKIAWYNNYKILVISTEPTSQTACESTNTSFSVLADNVVDYQWQVCTGDGFADITDNSTYSGSTTNNLSITNALSEMDSNIYRCQLTDEIGGIINSKEVYLYMTGEPTRIIAHPSNVNACPNSGDITLTTNATGSHLTYQWYKNDIPMSIDTSYIVTFGSAFTDAGTYYCQISGDCGSETSSEAVVIIIPEISIIRQPEPFISICPYFSNINLEFAVSGYNSTYQWYKNFSVINGETDSILTLTAISNNAGTYYCLAANECGDTIISNNSVVEIGGANSEVYLTNLAFYDETVVVGNDMDEYYGLPSTMSYNSSNPYNLINAGQYVRFKIECKNNLQSGQSIVFGECSITSNSPYITITDSTAGLNNIAWEDKAWSTDEFEIYINPATPNGHAAVFNFIVEESGNYYETSCIPVLVNPLACINEDYLIDDDSNPDSNGDDDEIIEPNETIEFLPYIDNVSNYDAEIIQGQFFNLDGYSDIYIWDEVIGISDTVYDWSWWNYSFGNPSPIAAGETHMQPQYDFVFDYNYTDTYKFNLYMIFSGGFLLFDGSPDLTLLRFATLFVFNKFYSEIPTSINEKNIITSFSVYPNPTNGKIAIEGKYIEFIEIIDINGPIIEQINVNKDKINIDLSSYSQGLYFIKILTAKGIIVKKVIIE
ncbi:FG-GAP-like repeat-containing protein, partial [Bacteroidota bacterium]